MKLVTRLGMEDKRDILKIEQPFSYKKTKDNKALIYWKGKNIMIINGKKYDELMALESLNDSYDIQMYLAKQTGNFKHGNEKPGKGNNR